MPKGARINATQPYTTISPRRALHQPANPDGVLHGKVVRQAGNPNCDLRQRVSGGNAARCGERRSDGTIRALVGPTAWLRNDTDPDWAPASLKSCARWACETGLDIKEEYYDQDTRNDSSIRTTQMCNACYRTAAPRAIGNGIITAKINISFKVAGLASCRINNALSAIVLGLVSGY